MKQQCEAAQPEGGDLENAEAKGLLSVQEIMDGLEDIIDVAGPDFQESNTANEKTAKQMQQTKLVFKQHDKPSTIKQ